MAAPIVISERVSLRVPPAKLWAFLSDTERMNRAVDLPPVTFLPLPDRSKKGHYHAETRWLGMKLAYEEFPFEWVEGRYYRVVRRYDAGPIERITGGLRFHPAEGGAELEVFAELTPRSWVGSLLAGKVGRKAVRGILELARAFERHSLDPDREPAPALPPPATVREDVLDSRLAHVKGDGPVAKLRRHLLTAGDLEVVRMRPFELADRWGEDRMRTLRLFLNAARAGALDLAWDVLCPNCRVPSRRILTLSQMKSQAHCETCDVRFGADFAASVEARFSANPAVREARRATYCIGGPANVPDIAAQLRLEPGETRKEAFPGGALRVRCYQSPGILPLAGERVRVEAGGVRVERGEAGTLEVSNALSGEALVVVERDTWREQAATAALVTSLQDFRDLFPAEAVAPGEEIGIASLAVLFTDLKGSTELYQKLGDPKAFSFVQNHFRYLVETVSDHKGGVVKTMGDAVMATFAAGRDALEAAVEMQRGWAGFRREHGDYSAVSLKIGLHQGPAIAINNAGKLDFFGTTVNMAARVQAQSEGDDVVFTRAIEEDPQVRAYLASEGGRRETLTVALKGLAGDHTLIRSRLVKT